MFRNRHLEKEGEQVMNTQGTNLYGAGHLVGRREFVTGAVDLVGGVTIAAALLPAIKAQADIVPKDDPRLHT